MKTSKENGIQAVCISTVPAVCSRFHEYRSTLEAIVLKTCAREKWEVTYSNGCLTNDSRRLTHLFIIYLLTRREEWKEIYLIKFDFEITYIDYLMWN